MHTIKVNFEVTENEDSEQVSELANGLLGAWRMNGQILGKQFPIAQTENHLQVYVNVPDSDSLSEKYNNKYVNETLSKLKEQKVRSPKITILGKEPYSAILCDCKKIRSFILFTTYIFLQSPLKCADCFGVVPLYKISKTAKDEYYSIICWQSDYESCDSLQMNCGVGGKICNQSTFKI